ncbi:MAG: YitT family protein [Peptostreptococcus sp.]|uniref:YitT family protein n=1 Tax=Peptostreptococcus TaxID=1257 RepID=UPI00290056F9|nr:MULTISPECIES: YitT family protein [Peptostreptococcus]MDU1174792.1 YitT family protein [Peptostreptococcus anaerobius]MDU1234343.1 YitT family protein [Peptostreptococcus anaerobius]MDU1266034.1 YitT family protein [Peptostreptococcus sp.]
MDKIDLKNFIYLTIAGIVNAFGVTIFLAPVKLYDSGISGTSMLLSQMTPPYMSLSFFLILLNIPLFMFGLKKQGREFTVYAVYAVMVYSIAAWYITEVSPIDVSVVSPLAGSDLLLCALFGGIISGTGSGIALRCGGAMDGIEVMAVIFAKKLGVTVGIFVMVYNVILYVVCGLILSSWILPLYSIVTYMAALKTIDFIVDGIDRSKSLMIVTQKADVICEQLSLEFEEGITIMDGKGYYSDARKSIIYIVLNRFQIIKAKNIVHNLDPNAFITISEIADVFTKNHASLDN